jgi:hypothetical protein
LSGKIIECIHNNFRVMFSIYGLNLTIFWSFGYISHQDRLLKIFSSPVIIHYKFNKKNRRNDPLSQSIKHVSSYLPLIFNIICSYKFKITIIHYQ